MNAKPEPGADAGIPHSHDAVLRLDIGKLASDSSESWAVHPLARLHDTVASLAVIEGTYYRHHHTIDPELFIVLEGRLLVHLDERTHELGAGQALLVPPGVDHLSEAIERTVVLNIKGDRGATVPASAPPSAKEPGDSLGPER